MEGKMALAGSWRQELVPGAARRRGCDRDALPCSLYFCARLKLPHLKFLDNKTEQNKRHPQGHRSGETRPESGADSRDAGPAQQVPERGQSFVHQLTSASPDRTPRNALAS